MLSSSVLLDNKQRHPHIMVLHWFHTIVTVALVLLLPWQVYTQEEQTDSLTDTGNGPDVTTSDPLSEVLIVIIVAAVIGLVIAVILGLVCYFHYKRNHLGELSLDADTTQQQYTTGQTGIKVTSIELSEEAKIESNTATHTIIDTDHKPSPIVINKWKDFKTLLEELRWQADVLLVMLNDVRKRLKEAKHGNPRIEGYKAVIRDLSRVLFIINKKEDKIKMPPDGVELLIWAQQIVNKFAECQKIKEERQDSQSYGTPPEMSAVLWIQSKDDTAFEDKDHQESHII